MQFLFFFLRGTVSVIEGIIHKSMSHTTHPPNRKNPQIHHDPPDKKQEAKAALRPRNGGRRPSQKRRGSAKGWSEVGHLGKMGQYMMVIYGNFDSNVIKCVWIFVINYSKSTLKTLNCDLFDLCIIFLETSLEVGINIHSVIRLTVSFWSIESKSPWNSTFEMVELPRDHPHVVCWGCRQLGDLGTTVWTQQSNPAK